VARKSTAASTDATGTADVAGTPDTATDSRRGRPRPQITVERDKLVAAKMAEYDLTQEWNKAEVAEVTGLDVNVVYHCLNRLTWSGVVEPAGRGKFRRTEKEYTQEYTQRPEKVAKAAKSAPVAAEA
jgi:hypothetical protein